MVFLINIGHRSKSEMHLYNYIPSNLRNRQLVCHSWGTLNEKSVLLTINQKGC